LNVSMKCLFSVIFFLATVQLLHGIKIGNNRRFIRSLDSTDFDESEEIGSLVTPCLTAAQHDVTNNCLNMTMDWIRTNYIDRMIQCIDASLDTEKDPSIKEPCETNFIKEFFMHYTECYFSRIGQNSIATDPVDLESFKAATIEATDLDDAQKIVAVADFDSCMAASYSLPYTSFSFRSEKIPDILQGYVNQHRKIFNFGQLAPTPSILAIDCMETVLLQDGCGTTSEEVIAFLMQHLQPRSHDKMFQCKTSDHQWLEDVCNDFSMEYLGTRWMTNCTKGKTPAEGGDGCRIHRMKQLLKVRAECLMQRSKAANNVLLYKKFSIGGTNLSDEKKTAAMASFDQCMAKDFTLPYQFFPFESEKIHGPVLLKNLTVLVNQVFHMGNLPPTMQMRVVDCAGASLLLNGCDSTTSDETLIKLMNGLHRFEEHLVQTN